MAKPDSERGQYGAWIRRHRKRLFGNDLGGLTRALNALGAAGEPDTIRGWESGAKPGPDTLAALAQIFGEPAPEPEPMDASAVAAAIMELASAVRAQADAIVARQDAQDEWMREVVRALAESRSTPASAPTRASPESVGR